MYVFIYVTEIVCCGSAAFSPNVLGMRIVNVVENGGIRIENTYAEIYSGWNNETRL